MGFFAGEVWWNKVLTMDQPKRRGFPLASRCPLCGGAEDLNHLLIHCPMIWELWGALLSILGTAWVCPFLARDLIVGWKAFPTRKEDRKVWLAAPLHLLWATWKERNRVVFENTTFSSLRLKASFILSLRSWVTIVLNQDS